MPAPGTGADEMISILVPLAVLTNGVAAGVMFSTVIGIVPMTSTLPYDRYVQTIRFLWPRYDPFMPIANAAAFVLDAIVAILAGDATARAVFIVAAVLLGTVMAISVVKNVPINKYVTSLDPARQPPDWADRDPRVRWRNWNLLRTSLALVALTANVVGVGVLI